MSVRIDKPRRGWSTVLMGVLIMALVAASFPTASTAATPARMQSYLLTLAQETPDEWISVIIQKQTPTAGLEGFVTRLGGKITKDLRIINAFGAQVTASILPILARAPGVRWISLDAPVYEMNATSSDPSSDPVQVRDEFNTFSYAGSDGTRYWGEPWLEMGESDGPELGDVAVTRFWGGALQGLRLQGADKSLWRQVNLTAMASATVSFSYRRKGFVDAADYIALEATHDGNTWQELGRLSGPATDADLQHVAYDLTDYRAATAAIRFVTSPSLQEQAKFYLDQVTIESTPATVDYAYQVHLPLISTAVSNNDSNNGSNNDSNNGSNNDSNNEMASQQRPNQDGRAANTTLTYYLHNDPMPAQGNTSSHAVLPLSMIAPTETMLYNYDTNRDSAVGLLLAKGGSGVYENAPVKIQRWRSTALTNALSLRDNATLTLYAAMKDFQSNKRGIIHAYLIDRSTTQLKVIVSSQVTQSSWGSGWQAVTIHWGVPNYTIPAGHQLEIAVVVGNDADDDMWLAYGVTNQAARVTVNVACTACIDTTHLASTQVEAIAADQVWNEAAHIQGQGISVAVVDSGIALHDDFRDNVGNSRILAQVDFTGSQGAPDDFYGHGTHVAGTIGGNGTRSGGKYMGVAPKVNLIDVKVTNDYGAGNMSDVVAGLQWIYNNKALYNIRVANLSLNSSVAESYHTSPLNAALEILWFNGIVVVVSAGNNGNDGILYPPANDPFVITAGAVDTKGTASIWDDILALFSDHGTTQDGFVKPDLIVPGANIIAALASDDSNLALGHAAHTVTGPDGTHYFRMSGTSMASAVAAGAVALLLQDEPTLTPDQVKYRLRTTAVSLLNAKYLNIYAAVHGTTTQSANTGVTASQLLWTGTAPITWGSASWNSVSWNTVSWNTVSWNTVSWNTVSWNTVHWDD